MSKIFILFAFAMTAYGSVAYSAPVFDVCKKADRLVCRKVLRGDWPEELHLEIDVYQMDTTQSVGILFKMGNSPVKTETACLGAPIELSDKNSLLSLKGDFKCLDGTGGTVEYLFDRKAMTLAYEQDEPYACQCEPF